MSCSILLAVLFVAADEPRAPRFRAQVIDDKVGIGYGVAVADVDGDGKADIILVDKEVISWYRNPDWEKLAIVRKLTPIDHVCLAARDLDGDGRCEIAAGAGWNPSDTVGSGSVHYLVPPSNRSFAWGPIDLPHEPTVHRMRWILGPGKLWHLAVAPLHGRGNKDGQGEGARVLVYQKPGDPKLPWATEVVDDTLHVIHNLEIVNWDDDPNEEILLAAKEGVFHYRRGPLTGPSKWIRTQLAGNGPGESAFQGASEVRIGLLPGGRRFLATVEPFHGNKLAVYPEPTKAERDEAAKKSEKPPLWARRELAADLAQGHALACGDLAGAKSDQVVIGWRNKNGEGKVGIRIYTPHDGEGKEWTSTILDDNTMACEDLVLKDLNGDGKLDVVAAGRDSHNLKVYWNERP